MRIHSLQLQIWFFLILTTNAAADILVTNINTNVVSRYAVAGTLISSFGTGLDPASRSASRAISGPDGNIYVSWETHFQNNPGGVLQFSPVTGLLRNFTNDGVAGRGIAFGPDGTLYVARIGQSQIARYSSSGAFLGLTVPFVDHPENLFILNGELYVGSSPNPASGGGRIQVYDLVTGVLKRSFGAFPLPRGISLGLDGNLYVSYSDLGVMRFTTAGQPLGTFIAPGTGGLQNANDLAFGPDGNLYVVSTGLGVLVFNGTTGGFVGNLIPGTGQLQYDLAFAPGGTGGPGPSPGPGGSCGTAIDVTSRTRVDRSAFIGFPPRFLADIQTVGVTNTSGQTLPGPIYLVFDGLPRIDNLYCPFICNLSPGPQVTHCQSVAGSSIVLISATDLAPGQNIMNRFAFSPASTLGGPNAKFGYTPRVLSGVPVF